MTHISRAKKIYIVGIGGIGTSALAQLLAADGARVVGEDVAQSPITDMLTANGVDVWFETNPMAIATVDLLIYSSAVPQDNPSRAFARENNIPELTYFEALGEYASQFEHVIAVSGTHGKTTTTALIANLLVDAGLNPTAVVGSIVKEFGNQNSRCGGSDKTYFVVEACEHEAHFLLLRPTIAVITNIEADHLDYYRDLDHIVETFQTFVDTLPDAPMARLIVNADDARARSITTPVRRVSYGIEQVADVQALDVGVEAGRQFFTVANQAYTLHVPGAFNVSNSLAAIAVGTELGISQEVMVQSLSSFHGTWRRFEHVGVFYDAPVISDYAHHPTAVRATIRAAKEFFPGKRIVAVFQPHQRARTKELFPDFLQAFIEAGVVILQEVYDVAGREEPEYADISSQHIVDALKDVEGQVAVFAKTAQDTREALEELVDSDDVILIMGAGDIYKLATTLVTT